MRKILMILVFMMLFVVVALGVQGAEVHGNMQIGYIFEIDGYETEINVQFLPWRWLEIYAGVNVLMEGAGGGHFYPFNDRYTFGVKGNITEHIYIDGYHHCSHWVSSAAHRIYYDRFTGGNKTSISIGIGW